MRIPLFKTDASCRYDRYQKMHNQLSNTPFVLFDTNEVGVQQVYDRDVNSRRFYPELNVSIAKPIDKHFPSKVVDAAGNKLARAWLDTSDIFLWDHDYNILTLLKYPTPTQAQARATYLRSFAAICRPNRPQTWNEDVTYLRPRTAAEKKEFGLAVYAEEITTQARAIVALEGVAPANEKFYLNDEHMEAIKTRGVSAFICSKQANDVRRMAYGVAESYKLLTTPFLRAA